MFYFFGLSEHFFDSSFFVILKQKCDIITQGGNYLHAQPFIHKKSKTTTFNGDLNPES